MRKKSLVIVESPSKAKTINKLLGSDNYVVKATVGHVKDLPKSKLGVNIEKGFKPQYVTIKGKKKTIYLLKEAARKAKDVFLAPDPDREGEAIAWHIASELEKENSKIYRVLFNEITKNALKKAFDNAGDIDEKKVDAQQARRVLDRLVGYKISPILWKKLTKGLSAGRVQSVALRLVCEREREISTFRKEEYWSITAEFKGEKPSVFKAKLQSVDGEKVKIGNESYAKEITDELKNEEFKVIKIDKKERKRKPVPPFITSTLQQEAYRHLSFSANKTMVVAQQLYEGLDIGDEGITGLITYMRTDSTRVAREAQESAREFIGSQYGSQYLPEKPPIYPSKKGSQDAHEAIRPTSALRNRNDLEKHLSKDQLNLYHLVWQRFVASQMKGSVLDSTAVDIKAGRYIFRANGSVLKFDGFIRVYMEMRDEEGKNGEYGENVILPPLSESQILKLLALLPKQHFTEPPPRYSEATLVKELEKKGIGRPSTYASIMSKIQDRNYTIKENRRFQPTELGQVVSSLLTENFPAILNVEFTASLEDKLDKIEEGNAKKIDILRDFYESFEKSLKDASAKMEIKDEPTDIACDKCGTNMVKKWGRNGFFLACPSYPECNNTKDFTEDETGKIVLVEEEGDERCDKCGRKMMVKKGRFGKFWACSGYPECKNTKQRLDDSNKESRTQKDLKGEKCPKCDKLLTVKKSKFGEFIACSGYPECKFIKALGTDVNCPLEGCKGELVARKSKKGQFFSCSTYPKCKFAIWDRPIKKECPLCGYGFLLEKTSVKAKKAKCGDPACSYEETVD